MSEIQYVWGDPAALGQQVALSSLVKAMLDKGVVAVARWISREGMDPKMGVLWPVQFENTDCLLWAQVHFVCFICDRGAEFLLHRCLSQTTSESSTLHL